MNTNTINQFFTKFNNLGNLMWSSYYGGSCTSNLKSINITRIGNSIFLYGSTTSNTGFCTEGEYMPSRIPNTGLELTGFFARINLKQELSTSENFHLNNLFLYDNPNHGIFTLSGDVLKKKNFDLTIYDLSGKLLGSQKMNNSQKQVFDYHKKYKPEITLYRFSAGNDFVKSFKMIVK